MQMQRIGSDGRPIGAPTLAAFVDEKNGLMWAAADVSTEEMNWQAGFAAAEKCNLLGFTDWRVPTDIELQRLVDRSRFNPAADPELELKSNAYWTSTPLASASRDYAWVVLFNLGGVDVQHQDLEAFVRLVRSLRASQ